MAISDDVPVNLESVEEKRDEETVEESPVKKKKPRFDEEVNRVAEIVLVLSALRKIRGGKPPTELEIDLMVEAKSKLVDMCQEFTPKDIIGVDAIGAVIEDLGFNGKLKDQRLGFRAPKLTISEKLSLGKRKVCLLLSSSISLQFIDKSEISLYVVLVDGGIEKESSSINYIYISRYDFAYSQ